jgi:hypothetical protein
MAGANTFDIKLDIALLAARNNAFGYHHTVCTPEAKDQYILAELAWRYHKFEAFMKHYNEIQQEMSAYIDSCKVARDVRRNVGYKRIDERLSIMGKSTVAEEKRYLELLRTMPLELLRKVVASNKYYEAAYELKAREQAGE